MKIIASLLLAWSLFGQPEPKPAPEPAKVDEKALQEAVERAVKSVTEQAVKAAAEQAARDAASAKAEDEKAEKLRAEAKEAAKEAEARAEAEKKEAKAEALAKEKADEERAEKQKAERLAELKRISTKTFKLEFASAEEVAERFNSTWSGEFGEQWKIAKIAQAFPEANSVMVTAPTAILEACEKVIKEVDVEPAQVYIEARFVELGNTASHKVGIDWSMLGGMKGTVSLGGGTEQYKIGKAVKDYTHVTGGSQYEHTSYSIGNDDKTSGHNGSITYFKGTLDFSEMYLVLKALDETEDSKTFSNPKIIVSSGKRATVDMTTKYPNVSVSAKRTNSGQNINSLDLSMQMSAIPGEDKFMFAKESFFSWGISLEVTPRIGTNGLINVSIVPTISNVKEFISAANASGDDAQATYSAKYPIIDVKRLVTEFNLKSGATAVIGGLSKTEEVQIDNGIPLLRDIPWIGQRLFGSMERVKKQKEIIVFVTVGLVDPQDIKSDAGLPKNAVLGRQYMSGQKLEPGDRPQRNMEGVESLDMRPLEEQAKDPLRTDSERNFAIDWVPFRKDPDYRRKSDSKNTKQENEK